MRTIHVIKHQRTRVTKDKKFKKKVREHAKRTGESYSTARAAMSKDEDNVYLDMDSRLEVDLVEYAYHGDVVYLEAFSRGVLMRQWSMRTVAFPSYRERHKDIEFKRKS